MKFRSALPLVLAAATLALNLSACNESTDNSSPLTTPLAPAQTGPTLRQTVAVKSSTEHETVRLEKNQAYLINAKTEANSDLGTTVSVACRAEALSGKQQSKSRKVGVKNRITLEQGSTLIVQRDMTMTDRNGEAAYGHPFVAIVCAGEPNDTAVSSDASTEVVTLGLGVPTSEYPIVNPKWNTSVSSTVVCRASATEQLDEVIQGGAVMNRLTLLKGSRALVERNLDYKFQDGSTLREQGAQRYALLDCAL